MRFELGRTVVTPAALKALGEERCSDLVLRHSAGDWGVLPLEDKVANELALRHGDRIVSRYDWAGESFYVITEADRSSTCVLLVSEY